MVPKPTLEGEGATDYERYLKVGTLLSALKPDADLANRDERLFQVVHQSAELWFHQIRWDIAEVKRLITADKLLESAHLMRRSVQIVRLLTDALHVLDGLIPKDYHEIRIALGRGSGQESPGFNGLLEECPPLQGLYLDAVARAKVMVEDVVMHPYDHYALNELGDALVDFDMVFHLWRQHHLAFVKRVIGSGQRSLKGYGVDALERLIVGSFMFPKLLDSRDWLTLETGTSPPGKRPGESSPGA